MGVEAKILYCLFGGMLYRELQLLMAQVNYKSSYYDRYYYKKNYNKSMSSNYNIVDLVVTN